MTRWAALLVMLSLLVGCGPALTPRTPQASPGEPKEGLEDRLIALRALPPAEPLNAEVTLWARGGALLVSNDPEYLTDPAVLPGALYRDELAGTFRVFYHHTNGTQAELTLAAAVTNTRSAPVLLFRRGLGQGTDAYPDVAGQRALDGYLGTRYGVAHVTTLAPGESALVAAHTARPGETLSALGEFVAVTSPSGRAVPSPPLVKALQATPFAQNAVRSSRPDLPPRFSLAAVTLTIVAYSRATPKAPQSLPVLPGDSPKPIDGTPYYFLKRGTFPFFDRYAEVPLTSDTATMLTIDSAAFGPFSRAMRGEYLLGTDVVDGKEGYNNGNYGVLYNLRLYTPSSTPLGFPFAFLMQPSGGFGHYALQAEGDVATSPFVSHENAWWFYRARVFGPEYGTPLRASLAGGAFGPQKFLFIPYPRFEE